VSRPNPPCLSVLLVEPRPVRATRYRRAIDGAAQLSLTGAVRDLTEAYNLTEHHNPDLVLLSEEMVHRDNFPMYGEMLAMLEIEALVIADTVDSDRAQTMMPRPVFGTRRCLRSGFPRVTERRIEDSGGLIGFLTERSKLARVVCHGRPAAARIQVPTATHDGLPTTRAGAETAWKTVVIGASTGGVEALIELFSTFPEYGPPTLVVQHINGDFLPGLAQRLDRHCLARVRPATSGDPLEPGTILMAPGNSEHLTIGPQARRCRLVAGAPVSGHRPSVDMLFQSAVALGSDAVGVILTGMGRDGAQGLLAMRRAGATTFGQDQASCTVYGMPRAAMELGAVSQQLPISELGPALLSVAAAPRAGVRHA
jgi:two-component system chemotaxis response regulator CheB